ncbi:MAG: dapA, partial [Deinococcus sp.]|nr:dapA [Deinococcus sp.]
VEWRGLANGPSRLPLPNLGAEEKRALIQQLETFARSLAADGLPLVGLPVRDAVT